MKETLRMKLETHLKGDCIVNPILLGCNFLHFIADVLLSRSFHIYVIAVRAGIVTGDGLK